MHEQQALLLAAIQIRIERQLRHANDTIHRRADLVAHIRQELGLAPVRELRRLTRRRVLLDRLGHRGDRAHLVRQVHRH